jgi:hypothetical protein
MVVIQNLLLGGVVLQDDESKDRELPQEDYCGEEDSEVDKTVMDIIR